MSGGDFSPWEHGDRGDVVPKGDEGEQLIANVLLATMVSQLYSGAPANAYIKRADALARTLAQRSVTYRPPQAAKFARVSFEVEGQLATSLVSVVNDTLVLPAFHGHTIRSDLLRSRQAIKFVEIELVRFILRFRMRRIVSILEPLQTIISLEALTKAAEDLVTECLRHEVRSEEPLGRASDCFLLAHDLVGRGNYSLAALLLAKANRSLDTYFCSTKSTDHRAVIQSMKSKIASLLAEIAHSAA